MDVVLALNRTLQTCSRKQSHRYMHSHLIGHMSEFTSQRVTCLESTTHIYISNNIQLWILMRTHTHTHTHTHILMHKYSVTPQVKQTEFPLYMDIDLALSRTLQTCNRKQSYRYMHSHLIGHTPEFTFQRVTCPESTTHIDKCENVMRESDLENVVSPNV